MATSRVKPVSAAPVVKSVAETETAAAKVVSEIPAALAADAIKTPVSAPAAAVKSPAAAVKGVAHKLETVMSSTKENVEKASQAFFKGYDKLATVGKDNVDAVVKSGTIIAKGYEELGRALIALTQANLEQAVAVAKASLTCTTLKQVVDLHSDYARTSFDKLLAEGNKLSELSIKVANEAIAPIQGRVTVAVEKFAKPAA